MISKVVRILGVPIGSAAFVRRLLEQEDTLFHRIPLMDDTQACWFLRSKKRRISGCVQFVQSNRSRLQIVTTPTCGCVPEPFWDQSMDVPIAILSGWIGVDSRSKVEKSSTLVQLLWPTLANPFLANPFFCCVVVVVCCCWFGPSGQLDTGQPDVGPLCAGPPLPSLLNIGPPCTGPKARTPVRRTTLLRTPLRWNAQNFEFFCLPLKREILGPSAFGPDPSGPDPSGPHHDTN